SPFYQISQGGSASTSPSNRCDPIQFDQLIDEPTRITGTSATLIDLILTNKEENISKSGVIHLGLSDHSMIFAIRKHCIPKSREKVKHIRNFKNFNANDFLTDLSQMPWENIAQHDNSNVCWQVWKSLYLQVLDRHAPLRRMRTRGNSLPWISSDIKGWSRPGEKRVKINTVFLDLQKAFDTINNDILLTKLDLYGLQKPSLNLLGSYLANRTQMCSVNGALSGTKLVTCGIPQGSILGPLLFLIYINDLLNSLEYSSTRMFADDTTLTVSGKSIHDVEVAINHDLTNVKQWLSANRLSLNLVKT
ncbi:Hypothetical predicted protein, partial [Paramuricea clavata]